MNTSSNSDIDEDIMFPKRSVVERVSGYCRRYGIGKTVIKIGSKILHIDLEGRKYDRYVRTHMITEKELEMQKKAEFEYTPLISVVIPVYHTPLNFLKELIESFLDQSYSNWQLCLADGGEDDSLRQYVLEYSNGDSRVVYGMIGSNDGISSNTNAAIAMATGEWIGFSDHDDLVTPDALYEVVKTLNEDSEIDSIYTDEDKIDMSGNKYFDPHFKPDYNIDLLCSGNYITHFFLCRRSVIDKAGLLNPKFDGSQDYDMIFRCAECSRKVHHIPKVLYHWRCHENSTAMNPESKMYCYEAGRGSLKAHWDRLGVPTETEITRDYGYYRTRYRWDTTPDLDIIIAARGDNLQLQKCINNIREKSTYLKYNITVVISSSETEDDYIELEKEGVNFIFTDSDNLSMLYQVGMDNTKADYVLLLDSNMNLHLPATIKEMMDVCMRDDVGSVGTRIYDSKGIMRHAGIVIDNEKNPRYLFAGVNSNDPGYYHRMSSTVDVTAISMRCILTKRDIYEAVSGFDREMSDEYAQIDYGLKIEEMKKLNVYIPYGGFIDFDEKELWLSVSESVGCNDSYMKLKDKWKDIFDKYDRHYNPNFADASYTLKL